MSASPRVLILGATSAIAAEVALVYARRGAALRLIGRSPTKLAAVVERCAKASPGAAVESEVADFTCVAESAALVARAIERLGGLDVVLIAHGDLGDQLESERAYAAAEETLRTNLLSVVALLVPLANELERVGRGTLGVITSVAGDRGRPRNYTYATAKGALHVYLQGLRSRLYPRGVRVVTLKLGPVDTPMTREHEKTRLFGEPVPVAVAIVRALDAGTPEAYVPWFWAGIMPLVRLAPEFLFQRLRFLSGR